MQIIRFVLNVTLVAAVYNYMTLQGIPGLTLPEISTESIEDYERSWTRYELIACG